MRHGQYLIFFIISFIVALSFAAGFNYFVDPYGLFGARRSEGFNDLKPKAGDRVRVVKPYAVERGWPRTLIAGNSRPEMGLDPSSPCWDPELQPVYNLAIPGASTYMQVRYVQHALEIPTVDMVFLGLDFVDFLVSKRGPKDFSLWPKKALGAEKRLRVLANGGVNTSYFLYRLSDMLMGLFSLGGVGDSVATFLAQRNPNAATRRLDGFNPARDYLDIISAEGQRVLFRQKNQEVLKSFSNPALDIYQRGSSWSTEFESLRRFLQIAAVKGVRVILFINPYHGEYLTIIDMAGKWPLLEQWKRSLVKIAEEEGEVPLWDFNAFNTYTIETLPDHGDTRTLLQWFWEPAHYRHELGELMLARMLQSYCMKSPEDEKFGVRLITSSIESHLDNLRVALQRFKTSHPEILKRLRGRQNRVH